MGAAGQTGGPRAGAVASWGQGLSVRGRAPSAWGWGQEGVGRTSERQGPLSVKQGEGRQAPDTPGPLGLHSGLLAGHTGLPTEG